MVSSKCAGGYHPPACHDRLTPGGHGHDPMASMVIGLDDHGQAGCNEGYTPTFAAHRAALGSMIIALHGAAGPCYMQGP